MIVGALLDVRTSNHLVYEGTYYESIGQAQSSADVRRLVETDAGSVVAQLEGMLERARRLIWPRIGDDAILSMSHHAEMTPQHVLVTWHGSPVWLANQKWFIENRDGDPIFDSYSSTSFGRTSWGLSAMRSTSTTVPVGTTTWITQLSLDSAAILFMLALASWWVSGLAWMRVAGSREGMRRWRRVVQSAACLGALGLALVPHQWEATIESAPSQPMRTSSLTRGEFEEHIAAGTAENAVREAIISMTEGVPPGDGVAFSFHCLRTEDRASTTIGWPSNWIRLSTSDWWVEPLATPGRPYGISPDAKAYELPGRGMSARVVQGRVHVYLPIGEGATSSRSMHLQLTGLSINLVVLVVVWWAVLGVTVLAQRRTERIRAKDGRCRRCGYSLAGYPSDP